MKSLFYSPDRVARIMDEAGSQALIAVMAPNIQYLTGYRRGGDSLAVLRREDLFHPDLVVSSVNVDYCQEDPCEPLRIHTFGFYARAFAEDVALDEREQFIQRLHNASQTKKTSWELAAGLLQAAGLAAAQISVDGTADSAAALVRLLPNLQVNSAPNLYRRLRMIKTGEEIQRLEEAARITENAILTSAQSAGLGTTQRQLARVFNLTVIKANGSIRSDNASIGRGSALGNLNSPADVVEVGSILRYDVGVHYEGYASDVARCFVFKRAGDKERRIHDAILAGLEKALELIRPGAAACEIFDATVAEVRRAGIPHFDRHHVGHGIGIAGAGYELPLLGPAEQTPLQPGMILCVETPYVELGFGCLQVEDMLVVTQDGYRLLTHTDHNLQVLP